jgi:hypothetical protein
VEVEECVFTTAAFLAEDVECVVDVEECVDEWEDLCLVDGLPESPPPPPPPPSNSQSPYIIPALADAKKSNSAGDMSSPPNGQPSHCLFKKH